MRIRPVVALVMCLCLAVGVAAGTTFKSIVIDGVNDFSADETVAGTSGSTWYFTWDADNLYIGSMNQDLGSPSDTKWVLLYVDTDPQMVPSGGTGTQTGLTYNTQQPSLPFTANFHLRWKTDDSYMDLQWFNGTSWESGNQSGLQRGRAGTYFEVRIPRSNIGSPGSIYVCTAMIEERGGSEWTYNLAPSGQSDGYDRDYARYFGFPLDAGRSPSDVSYLDAPLPIQMTSFRAHCLPEGFVRLDWTTASESNNYGFEVQRAVGAEEQFVALPGGFVPGNGTTVISSNYSYIDSTVTGGTWFYRLRQIDLDRSSQCSEAVAAGVISGVVGTDLPSQVSLFQNYPNPFNPATMIHYGLPARSTVLLTVHNTLGQQVAVLVRASQQAGYYSVRFENPGLASGVYFYRLQAGDFVQTRRLILQR